MTTSTIDSTNPLSLIVAQLRTFKPYEAVTSSDLDLLTSSQLEGTGYHLARFNHPRYPLLILALSRPGPNGLELTGFRSKLIGSPPVKPYAEATVLSRNRIAIGILATVPEVASLRMTAPEGQVTNAPVVNGVALLLASIDSTKWTRTRVQVLDNAGASIVDGPFRIAAA